MDNDRDSLQAIRELVVAREVCWDVFHEKVGFLEGGVKSIGYELVLAGIHADGNHAPIPGCELCHAVYDDLRRLGEWIVPHDHRPSIYEIEPFHAAIHRSLSRHLRQEVQLPIRILHRHHYDAPIDQCETRCLIEMEDRLRDAWACRGEWRSLAHRGLHP